MDLCDRMAHPSDVAVAEQADLNRQAEAAAAKAMVALEKAIESDEAAGVEPLDLELLATNAMPSRELTRKACGTPTKKTQRNFTDPESARCQLRRRAEVLLSSQQLQSRLAFWIDGYYNRERRHSTIGYLSPIDYEQQNIAARTLTTARP